MYTILDNDPAVNTLDSRYDINHADDLVFHFDSYCSLTEIKCDRQPGIQNAVSPVVRNATHGVFITYTCMNGHWFRPGVFSGITNCSIDGEWLPILPHCRGKLNFD